MPLLKPMTRKSVPSLVFLSMEKITQDLYLHGESIIYLPACIKGKILQKLTRHSRYRRLFSSEMLLKLIHPNLKCINLSIVDVYDQVLNVLSECRALTDISLRNCGNQNISSESLKNFFEKTNSLLVLDVSHCQQFDDSVLECLSINCKRLSELNCEGCNITDRGLKALAQHNKVIKCLTLSNIQITGEGVSDAVLNKNWRYLQELRLDNCARITDDVLKLVIENCPKIEILTFYNCSITDETSIFEEITNKCTNLKQLHWTISW